MNTQPEALRRAAELEACPTINYKAHAAELRRLHELALEQQGKIYALEMARSMEQKTAKLKQDALLEALKLALSSHGVMLTSYPPQDAWKFYGVEEKARAAIKMAEEGK